MMPSTATATATAFEPDPGSTPRTEITLLDLVRELWEALASRLTRTTRTGDR